MKQLARVCLALFVLAGLICLFWLDFHLWHLVHPDAPWWGWWLYSK